jgi:hypothetical protein
VYAFLLLILGAAVGPVGGFVESVHKQALIMPWLAIIGVVGCLAIVSIVVKKRRL